MTGTNDPMGINAFREEKANLLEKYFKMASAFDVYDGPDGAHIMVRVEKRIQRDGTVAWGIYCSEKSCFSKTEKAFVYESQPSSRTNESLADTRFTFEQAMSIAEQIAEQYRECVKKWENEDRKPWFVAVLDPEKIKI